MKSQGFEVTRATYFGASAVQWSILFPYIYFLNYYYLLLLSSSTW